MKILDVGCGRNKTVGSVGIDCVKLPGVDIVHDLNVFPWPLGDEEFDMIVARHSIQHLDNIINVMGEMFRILKHKGRVKIYVPHYASDNYNTDPTHKTHFGYRSMNYFCSNVKFHYNFYSENKFQLIDRYMSFRQYDDRVLLRNPFRLLGIEKLINTSPRLYERFFVYYLPVSEIYFELGKE